MASGGEYRFKLPTWDGKSATFEAFSDRADNWVLGTPVADRPLLGPRLVNSFTEGSQQHTYAKPVPKEEIVQADGVQTILQHLRRHMLRKSPSDAVAKYQQHVGSSVRRKPGVEDTEDAALRQLHV